MRRRRNETRFQNKRASMVGTPVRKQTSSNRGREAKVSFKIKAARQLAELFGKRIARQMEEVPMYNTEKFKIGKTFMSMLKAFVMSGTGALIVAFGLWRGMSPDSLWPQEMDAEIAAQVQHNLQTVVDTLEKLLLAVPVIAAALGGIWNVFKNRDKLGRSSGSYTRGFIIAFVCLGMLVAGCQTTTTRTITHPDGSVEVIEEKTTDIDKTIAVAQLIVSSLERGAQIYENNFKEDPSEENAAEVAKQQQKLENAQKWLELLLAIKAQAQASGTNVKPKDIPAPPALGSEALN